MAGLLVLLPAALSLCVIEALAWWLCLLPWAEKHMVHRPCPIQCVCTARGRVVMQLVQRVCKYISIQEAQQQQQSSSQAPCSATPLPVARHIAHCTQPRPCALSASLQVHELHTEQRSLLDLRLWCTDVGLRPCQHNRLPDMCSKKGRPVCWRLQCLCPE